MRMSMMVGVAVATSGAAGCSGADAPLHSEGPPEILQVLVRERVTVTGDDGSTWTEVQPHLAYGDHDDIDPEADDREVTAAVARDGQRIRIVVDELLRGGTLEEIPCADGSWSRVPAGTDFDDIAACAGADLSRCEAVCVGAAGPVGILDVNGDGAIDDTRLIDGAVALICGGEPVALDPSRSYYQPSGGQRLSAGATGTDSLGPAVVIVPRGMRPGSTCTLAFSAGVVDKQGEPVVGADEVAFAVEPFQLVATEPAAGATDVALTAPDAADAVITVALNAAVEPATVAAAVTVAGGDGPVTAAAAPSPDDDATLVITVPGGLAAATTYTVTISGGAGGLADAWQDPLSADATFSFTTRAP